MNFYKASLTTVKTFMAVAVGSFLISSCEMMPDMDDMMKDKDKDKDKQEMKMFVAHLKPLNNSGVTGTAYIKYSMDGMFQVITQAENVAAGKAHPQYIHGFTPDSDMANKKATCPPESAAGEYGMLTMSDGGYFYGPHLIPLDDELVPLSNGAFPVGNRRGSFSYAEHVATKELIAAFDAAYDGTQTDADLKLMNRVVVLHGAYVKDNKIVPRHESGASYMASLPIACGEIMMDTKSKK